MSTNKSLIKAYVEPIQKYKIDYLAKSDKRSASNLIEVLIDKYIEDYESKNGKLTVEEDGTVIPASQKKQERSSIFKSG